MAWPPPTMPTTRTDTTVMTTTHPAEHNAVNLAINDIVARVGAKIGILQAQPGTTFTTVADITGATVTFTPVTGRRYKIDGVVNFYQTNTAPGIINLYIADAANTALIAPGISAPQNSYVMAVAAYYWTAPSGAAVTFKLRASTSGGSCQLATPFMFSVTDWGT